MKCKYGNDNMVLNKDECLWHCSHCGYEKFAIRSFYNVMKNEAKNYKSKEEFVKGYDDCVSGLVARAWDRVHSN